MGIEFNQSKVIDTDTGEVVAYCRGATFSAGERKRANLRYYSVVFGSDDPENIRAVDDKVATGLAKKLWHPPFKIEEVIVTRRLVYDSQMDLDNEKI